MLAPRIFSLAFLWCDVLWFGRVEVGKEDCSRICSEMGIGAAGSAIEIGIGVVRDNGRIYC